MTSIKADELMRAVVAARAHRQGRLYAFVPVLRGDGYGLGVADLGQAGYSPLTGDDAPRFAEYDEAAELAGWLNAYFLGLHADDALSIVADTMSRSRDKSGPVVEAARAAVEYYFEDADRDHIDWSDMDDLMRELRDALPDGDGEG